AIRIEAEAEGRREVQLDARRDLAGTGDDAPFARLHGCLDFPAPLQPKGQMGDPRGDVDDVERRWPAEPSEAVQPTVVDVARRQFLNGPLDGRQGDGPEVAREVGGPRIAGALGDRAVVESHAEGLADRSG